MDRTLIFRYLGNAPKRRAYIGAVILSLFFLAAIPAFTRIPLEAPGQKFSNQLKRLPDRKLSNETKSIRTNTRAKKQKVEKQAIKQAKPVIAKKKTLSQHSGSGVASWYSRKDRRIKKYTASGEIFDDRSATCASWNFKFGTKLKVINKENGKHVVCRVNDRGPSKRYKRRVVDLTKSAFRKIADTEDGLVPVAIIPLEREGAKSF